MDDQNLEHAHEEQEITVEEVRRRLQNAEEIVLIDVREAWEREICKIPGDVHIPLRRLMNSIDNIAAELPRDKLIVPYCHTGNRSSFATSILREKGLKAKNMLGGVDEWAVKVDKGMERY